MACGKSDTGCQLPATGQRLPGELRESQDGNFFRIPMAVIAIASQRNAEALGNNAMAITAIKILKNFPSCDSPGYVTADS